MSAEGQQTPSVGEEVVAVVGALVAAVGPEVVKLILGHGATAPEIPSDVRATVHGIIYPDGSSKLASETEHDADLAAIAKAKEPALFPVDDGKDPPT